ncbi:hypothetical protein [Streptomyces sp. NPDC096323]|uniref:hypothetical protein n=1 Tax=Streptomyces sp. NPDC096323 TaxID=3155822 RepID=UPI00333045BD
MFQDRHAFDRAVEEARPLYIESAGEEDKTRMKDAFSDECVGVAFSVYRAAQWSVQSHKDKGLVAGNRLDQDEVIATEDIPGIDDALIKNFRTISELTKPGEGQVLDSDKWTILVNDAWLLGGAHCAAEFFLASPRTKENLYRTARPDWFKPSRTFRPGFTVFSRELIGLKSCGYEFVGHPKLGEIAHFPPKRSHPATFTFRQYQEKVNEYTKNDKWHELVGTSWR